MRITKKNHALYLDLNRFVSLEKENPKLLGKIIQERLKLGLAEIYQQHKRAGLPVTYREDNYPDCLIREEADGRRFIITLDPAHNYQEVVIREIPPRKSVN